MTNLPENSKNQDHSQWHRRLFICLLLAGITLGAFWPAGHLGFTIYDDQEYVSANPHVQAGLSMDSISWAFTTDDTGNWHPITWLSLMLDCQLFGLKSEYHHWMNIGLHVASVVMLFLVLCQLMAIRRSGNTMSSSATTEWCCALGAAFFAIHPLRVESVAWISERKDVLSAFFMMLTLWTWLCYLQKLPAGKLTSRFRLPTSVFYWLALVFFALGLMSKAMLVTLPVMLLLLDFWPLKRMSDFKFLPPSETNKYLIIEKLPFCLICLASCIVTYQVQNAGGSVDSLSSLSLGWRIENALVTYASYLEKTLWPENLAVIYPIRDLPAWEVTTSAVLLVAISGLCIWQAGRRPYLVVGWLWFLIMCLPVIGLVQIGKAGMADRYTYLPSIGICLMVGQAAAEAVSKSKIWRIGWAVAATGLVLAGVGMTRHQLGFWRSDVTMFQHAVDVTGSENYEGYLFLGNALTLAGRLDEAVTNYQTSIQIAPNEFGHEFEANYNLACVLEQQKKYPEAEAKFEEVIQHDYNHLKARVGRGRVLMLEKKYAEAAGEFSTALSIQPGNPAIKGALAAAQLKAEGEESLTNLEAALKVRPTADIHAQLAMLQTVLGNYQKAANNYQAALQLKPDDTEILNNAAWLLATCSDATVRSGAQAVKFAEHACELTKYQQITMIGTLAAAYAEAGMFSDAITTAQRACDLAKKTGQLELLQKNQQLLDLYRQHQVYHEAE